MLTTIRYILLTARRDWFFLGLVGAIALAASISYFLGGTALVEQGQMALTYMAGAARAIVNLGLVIFVCFHVRRAFENREIEVMLTRPISRTAFIFAYWAGFSVLALALNLLVIVMLGTILSPNIAGLVFWGASMILETLLVIAFALACSLILQSAVLSVMVTCGFYLIARMMGFFTAVMVKAPLPEFGLSWVLRTAMETVSVVLPRLDLYGKTKWLVYGVDNDAALWIFQLVPIFLMQSVVYIPLLLLMASFDFKRRQF